MAIAAFFVLASCSKTIKVDPVSFDVTTASTSYSTGDTVNFKFTGQPDMITFYSGERGHNYAYRDRTIAKGNPQMQFTTWARYGTQENTLHLEISSDFDGDYTPEGISKATWTDITDKATLSTGSNNTPSGIIDLSPYTEAGKTFYFAFKYTGTTGSTQKKWYIENFHINLLLEDSSLSSVVDISSAGWTNVSIKEDLNQLKITSTQVLIAGGPGSSPDHENWIVTKPLNPNKVSPDKGLAIKEISKNLYQYSQVYNNAGVFKAVFVGTNATTDEESSVIKTINLTIK